jgi:oligopeptide/dipeptide ABC transporter ATP-binding protein
MDTDREIPLATIPGRPPEAGEIPAGCPFAARCPHASARCTAERPELRALRPGQLVACWHPKVTAPEPAAAQ